MQCQRAWHLLIDLVPFELIIKINQLKLLHANWLTVLYHLIYNCSLSHKSIQLLDSLKLLNSFLHSSNWALALLGAAVWWRQRSLTPADSAGASHLARRSETCLCKQRRDWPCPAPQERWASLSRYRTVLEHGRYWHTVDAGWNVCCVPFLDAASSGRFWARQPCHWAVICFWGHWANSQGFGLLVDTADSTDHDWNQFTDRVRLKAVAGEGAGLRPPRSWGRERA